MKTVDKEDVGGPLQEIIGTVPSWITRWGITIMFVFLLVMFALGYMIRIPQVTSFPIVLSCENNQIIPNNLKAIGYIEIMPESIGPIKIGQSVNVTPDSYLGNETICGEVTGIIPIIKSLDSNTAYYHVNVSFPEGLRYSMGKDIPMHLEINGTAGIVTDSIYLIDYLLRPR